MISEARHREIEHRIRERYLLTDGDRWAFGSDAAHHAEIQRIRALFLATEVCMAQEGIPEPARDRVLYRLLYDESPRGYGQIDWREARERVRAREQQIREYNEQAWAQGFLRLPGDREP